MSFFIWFQFVIVCTVGAMSPGPSLAVVIRNNINYNRVELYTFDYAKNFLSNNKNIINPYKEVANFIQKNFPNIGLNAGHDLNLKNLDFFLKEIPIIKEVSIGHALVCDAFIFGLEKTIEKYKHITSGNQI